tara:strand:- start:107 stop:892 length:786 start_codon:yes stop_codon:yes gene_type:complete
MSIKLLTPISHIFNESDLADDILNLSDELEARERTCELNLNKTTHYHIDFDLNIGLTKNQTEFLENYVKPRENINTLTFQAARDCNEVILKNNKYHPNSLPLTIKDQLENTKNSLKQIRDIVGSYRNIGIENNNYYATGAYDICTSTEFLISCYRDLGLHLLFDIAHAIVTCTNKNLSFEEYKKTLLTNMKCKQIHLCEPGFSYGNKLPRAIDAHNLPSPKSTSDTLRIMSEWDIKHLTIEYYKDANILKEYLLYLKELIN